MGVDVSGDVGAYPGNAQSNRGLARPESGKDGKGVVTEGWRGQEEGGDGGQQDGELTNGEWVMTERKRERLSMGVWLSGLLVGSRGAQWCLPLPALTTDLR